MTVVHLTAREADLVLMAVRLWPCNEYCQTEWLRAVSVVRATSKGWLLDLVPQTVSKNVIPLERTA